MEPVNTGDNAGASLLPAPSHRCQAHLSAFVVRSAALNQRSSCTMFPLMPSDGGCDDTGGAVEGGLLQFPSPDGALPVG